MYPDMLKAPISNYYSLLKLSLAVSRREIPGPQLQMLAPCLPFWFIRLRINHMTIFKSVLISLFTSSHPSPFSSNYGNASDGGHCKIRLKCLQVLGS